MDEKLKAVRQALEDRYELSGVLGQGGASTVYKAKDLRLNSLVAIKVLHDDPLGVGAARLQREAQTSAKLQSPNIARVFNFGQTDDGTAYMVMELVEGMSLDRLIKERGRIEYKEAISIFLQICNGLALAHKHDVVHRDLKPANIILSKENKQWLVKILDFGIAKVETDQKLTSTGVLVGSPLYMAPEQATALDVDARTDIYSFGCMMFELLTGVPPIRGNTALETLTMHKSQAPPLVSDMVSDVPPALVQLVDQCLRKRPEDRPQSIDELHNKLDEVVTGKIEIAPISTSAEVKEAVPQKWESFVSIKSFVVLSVIVSSIAGGIFIYQMKLTEERAEKEKASKGVSYSDSFGSIPKMIDVKTDKFKRFASLEGTLYESAKTIIDADLEPLKDMRVDDLKILSDRLDGSGFKFLAGKKIRQLIMFASAPKPEYVRYLTELPELKDLKLNATYLDDSSLETLSRIKTLQDLTLMGGKFTKKGFEFLSRLNLTAITLNGVDITDKDFEPISHMKELAVVRLINCKNISPDIGVLVAKEPAMHTVFINRPMSKASYEALSHTKLLGINLKGKVMSPDEFSDICMLKSLYRINLSQARVTNEDYSALKKLPNLGRIEITNEEKISSALLATLLKLNLKELDFSHSGLSIKQLDSLISIKSLVSLDCFECPNITRQQLGEFSERYFARHKRRLVIQIPQKINKRGVQFDFRLDF